MVFTPDLRVEAGFGYQLMDDPIEWSSLMSYHPRNMQITRGRPSELGRYRSATLNLELVDSPTRAIDPTNLSGAHVETIVEEDFPVVAEAVEEHGSSLGTNNAQTLPTGVVAGDLLIAFVSVDNPGATDTTTGTGSATWTVLSNTLFAGNVIRQTIFARIATGSDALVLTGATQDYVCQIMRVVRHNCTTTADVEVATAATATSTTADSPSLATGSSHKYTWISAVTMDATIATTYLGIPADFTLWDFTTSDSTSTSSVVGMIATRNYEGETLNPGAWANESQEWIGQTLAIPGASDSYDETQIVPNLPIRVVAELASREAVLDDDFAGPKLNSAWRVSQGAITEAISGSVKLGTSDLVTTLYGPVYNFDGDSEFKIGISDDGSAPDLEFVIEISNGGEIGFTLQGSTLRWLVDDGVTQVDDTTTWNDTNHRYLRFRIDGDDVIFESSADDSSWSALDTFTRGTDFAASTDWSASRIKIASQGSEVEVSDFYVAVSQFTRFVGTVDQWNYSPLPGNQGAVVDVSATDAFKLFSNYQLDTVYADQIKSLEPDAWYRLGEKSGAVAFDSSGNGHHGNYLSISAAEQGGNAPTAYLGSGGVKLIGKQTTPGVRLPWGSRRTSYPYTVNMWLRTDGLLPNQGLNTLGNRTLGCVYTQASMQDPVTSVYDGWECIIGVQANYFDGIDNSVPENPVIEEWLVGLWIFSPSWTTGDIAEARYYFPNDGQPHMLTVVARDDSDFTLYIDGEEAPIHSLYTQTVYDFSGHFIGKGDSPLYYEAGNSFPGVVDELSMWSSELTNTQLRELHVLGKQPWQYDGAAERLDKLLDLIGWPTRLRTIDPGTVVLEPADIEGKSALDHMQAIESTEAGRLYIGMNGEVVFHDAARVAERTSTILVFDDAGTGVNILGEGFQITQDDRNLYTQAQVGTVSGQLQTYQDDVAVARYGPRAISIQGLLCGSDLLAYMRAVSLVQRYKRQQIKLEAFNVAPEKDPSDWPQILDMKLGDSINVSFTLLGSGDIYDENQILDIIEERLQDGHWAFRLQGSGEDPDYGKYLEWDATDDVGWDLGKWL